ncbi:MAG: ATP-binding cassette domain-containing protein [Clostridia bacterium]|nr:ATP-binding cassette domain-containing protein [Clostridia bacterium]
MQEVLKIEGLTKRYGAIRAIDGLNLEVQQGQVFGILGPNGSGKTTTLGILLDITRPDSGTFTWFGQRPTHLARRRIGATLESPVFYPYLSAINNLKIVANIKGIGYKGIDDVLELVGLYGRRHSKFRTYSLGMKQRLAIASVLLGDPEVLIFDEPTNGLDPQGIAEIRNLIIDLARRGQTILLASHLLDEVQKICSHVAIMRRGQRLFSGPIGDLSKETDLLELRADDQEKLVTALGEIDGMAEIKKEGNMLLVNLGGTLTPAEINKLLQQKGIVLSHLNLRRKSLEQEVLKLLEDQR